jgi:hypothetical protein
MKAIMLLLFAWAAFAGESLAQPGKQGFWVVEGNPKTQTFVTVRYYTAERRLIGQEVIRKRWIDLSRKRNIRRLNQHLTGRLAADSLAQVAALKK